MFYSRPSTQLRHRSRSTARRRRTTFLRPKALAQSRRSSNLSRLRFRFGTLSSFRSRYSGAGLPSRVSRINHQDQSDGYEQQNHRNGQPQFIARHGPQLHTASGRRRPGRTAANGWRAIAGGWGDNNEPAGANRRAFHAVTSHQLASSSRECGGDFFNAGRGFGPALLL
jgi:hypothetical protein